MNQITVAICWDIFHTSTNKRIGIYTSICLSMYIYASEKYPCKWPRWTALIEICCSKLVIISFIMRLTQRFETFAFQCKDACGVCPYCGGFQRLLCPICHGSKRSVHRNEFTVEFVALKCAKCDVFGMIRCPHCWRSCVRESTYTSAQIISLILTTVY